VPRRVTAPDSAEISRLSPVHVNWPSNAHFVERRIVERAAEQHGDDGADAQALGGRDVRRVQERLGRREREPVCWTCRRLDFARFTCPMPAASPGASRPLSVAGAASFADGRLAGGVAGTIPTAPACSRARGDVSSGVNPPERRASVSAATAEGRSARCYRAALAAAVPPSSGQRARSCSAAPAAAGRDAAEEYRRAAPLKFSGRKSVCGGDVQRRVEARRQRVCGRKPPEQ
jgi:hypothetical protein